MLINKKTNYLQINKSASLHIADSLESLSQLNQTQKEFLKSFLTKEDDEFLQLDPVTAIYLTPKKGDSNRKNERLRIAGDRFQELCSKSNLQEAQIIADSLSSEQAYAAIEGFLLGNYRFDNYFRKENKKPTVESLTIINEPISTPQIDELRIISEAVRFAKDLINEPASHLSSVTLGERITEKAVAAGIKVEVMNKRKIEALKMGGLLGVNQGSEEPPVFICMDYKPETAINTTPLVLIGKGVIFDTGGLNLKTGNFMENMKLDMGGAAAVSAALIAIAQLKLPVHVMAFIPSTDNRPGKNALAPGDVITISDGTTVEVLNTDAEGRLILADALVWAKQYNPKLVINIATLTGSAARAIGSYGMVGMQQEATEEMKELQACGEKVHERIVEFPFWEEYDDQIKGDIADLKNLGGPEAGAITAGKFLAYFTNYPFIHLDIAGPVFTEKMDSYRGKGATGICVRLLTEFAKILAQKQ